MSNLLFAFHIVVKPPGYLKKSFFIFLIIASLVCIGFVSFNGIFHVREAQNNTAFASLAENDETPEVQVFVPGFSVKEIPITLTNINVVRYGPDGRLYALAYDGRIYVLTDTNGDGIEDKVEYWWEKDPLVSPVGMV